MKIPSILWFPLCGMFAAGLISFALTAWVNGSQGICSQVSPTARAERAVVTILRIRETPKRAWYGAVIRDRIADAQEILNQK